MTGRALLVASLLGAAAVAAAAALWWPRRIGDEEKGAASAEGPLRFTLESAAADGVPPAEGWGLVGSDGRERPARVVESKPGWVLLEATGPAARYDPRLPAGWLRAELGPKPLQPGLAVPVQFFFGRERTIYVLGIRGETVRNAVVTREGAMPGEEVVTPDAMGRGADGRLVVRIGPEAWKPTLVVTALLGSGQSDGPSRLSAPLRLGSIEGPMPKFALMKPGPMEPLLVRVFRATDGEPAPRVPLRTSLSLTGLSWIEASSTGADATCLLDDLPTPRSELVTTIQAGIAEAVSATPFRAQGELRLLSQGVAQMIPGGVQEPPPPPALRVEFSLPSGAGRAAIHSIQARPLGGGSYALISTDLALVDRATDAFGFEIFLPAGRLHFFARFGDAGAMLDASITEKQFSVIRVQLVPLCRIAARIEGGNPVPNTLDLVAARIEDGKEILAQGWVQRNVSRADLEMLLPTGTYRIRLEDHAGRRGGVKELALETPGTRASIVLTPPR